jgi:hypothetical protein
MKVVLFVSTLLLTSALLHAAEEKPDLSRWKEDFSDEAAFMKNWASYGWLADGKVVSGPENMHRWWQIHDGAQPVAVRYAWKDWPDYSLANGAGLPRPSAPMTGRCLR